MQKCLIDVSLQLLSASETEPIVLFTFTGWIVLMIDDSSY